MERDLNDLALLKQSLKLRLAAQAEKLVGYMPIRRKILRACAGRSFTMPGADEFCAWRHPAETLAITRASTAQNAAYLAPAFLEGLRGLYGGTRLAAQELEGLGVDPSTTARGDACGIVVAGRLGQRG